MVYVQLEIDSGMASKLIEVEYVLRIILKNFNTILKS